jgi:serine/threonine protein kinase
MPAGPTGIDRDRASDWRLCGALDADQCGTIYLAERGHGGQAGALHLSAPRVTMAGAVDRLDAERRRLVALNHPAIVPILDVGLTDADQLFVVFEYQRGRQLREYLARHTPEIGATDTLLAEVAAALDHIHEAGLAHGAVSASSVMVSGNRLARRARLLGMGVRHLLAVANLTPAPTAAGDVAALKALRELVGAG